VVSAVAAPASSAAMRKTESDGQACYPARRASVTDLAALLSGAQVRNNAQAPTFVAFPTNPGRRFRLVPREIGRDYTAQCCTVPPGRIGAASRLATNYAFFNFSFGFSAPDSWPMR
jgi:hypothetical protein